MRDNQYADKNNLQPFYINITTAIREAVPDQRKFAIAYEPTWPVGDQVNCRPPRLPTVHTRPGPSFAP